MPIILLLSLVLLPIIWNGMSFLHYAMEHTHVFCLAEEDHEHTAAHDCSDIYHNIENQNQEHLPVSIDFQEIKQYLTPHSSMKTLVFSTSSSTSQVSFSIYHDRLFPDDIFHPPIS